MTATQDGETTNTVQEDPHLPADTVAETGVETDTTGDTGADLGLLTLVEDAFEALPHSATAMMTCLYQGEIRAMYQTFRSSSWTNSTATSSAGSNAPLPPPPFVSTYCFCPHVYQSRQSSAVRSSRAYSQCLALLASTSRQPRSLYKSLTVLRERPTSASKSMMASSLALPLNWFSEPKPMQHSHHPNHRFSTGTVLVRSNSSLSLLHQRTSPTSSHLSTPRDCNSCLA